MSFLEKSSQKARKKLTKKAQKKLKPSPANKEGTTTMLSIRIPQLFFVGGYHAPRRPIFPDYYKLWTPSDYAYVYQDANDTPYTWDDVEVPRRSPRLATKEKKNYKL